MKVISSQITILFQASRKGLLLLLQKCHHHRRICFSKIHSLYGKKNIVLTSLIGKGANLGSAASARALPVLVMGPSLGPARAIFSGLGLEF